MELAAPFLPPTMHKGTHRSSQDNRAERLLMVMITVYREGRGHLERQTEKLKAQRRDLRGQEEQQDEGVAKRVEMKKKADQRERDTPDSSLLYTCGNMFISLMVRTMRKTKLNFK